MIAMVIQQKIIDVLKRFVFLHRRKTVTLPNKPNSLTIFNFHQFGKQYNRFDHINGLFTEISRLESFLKYAKNIYRFVALDEAIWLSKRPKINGRNAMITIDDADKSVESAIETFNSHSIPIAIFPNGGSILENRTDPFRAVFLSKANSKRNIREAENLLSIYRNTSSQNEYKKVSLQLEEYCQNVGGVEERFHLTLDQIKNHRRIKKWNWVAWVHSPPIFNVK